MEMTEDEIVKKYKEAPNKVGYVQILADLNACKKSDINKILRKNGIALPGNPNFRKNNEKVDDNMVDKIEDDSPSKLHELDETVEATIDTTPIVDKVVDEVSDRNKERDTVNVLDIVRNQLISDLNVIESDITLMEKEIDILNKKINDTKAKRKAIKTYLKDIHLKLMNELQGTD